MTQPDSQTKLDLPLHPLQKVQEQINQRATEAHAARAESMEFLRRSLGQKIRWMGVKK